MSYRYSGRILKPVRKRSAPFVNGGGSQTGTYISHSKEYESTLYGTYNCVFCYVNKTPKTGLGQNPSLSEGRGGHELQIDTQYARVGTVPASRQRSPPADHEKRWKNTRSAMVSMEFPGSPLLDGNNIKVNGNLPLHLWKVPVKFGGVSMR